MSLHLIASLTLSSQPQPTELFAEESGEQIRIFVTCINKVKLIILAAFVALPHSTSLSIGQAIRQDSFVLDLLIVGIFSADAVELYSLQPPLQTQCQTTCRWLKTNRVTCWGLNDYYRNGILLLLCIAFAIVNRKRIVARNNWMRARKTQTSPSRAHFETLCGYWYKLNTIYHFHLSYPKLLVFCWKSAF